jgi:hypothetical protein
MLRRTLLPTASLIASIALICAAATLGPRVAQGLGPDGVVDIRVLEVGDGPLPRPTAAQRLAWEVRHRCVPGRQ